MSSTLSYTCSPDLHNLRDNVKVSVARGIVEVVSTRSPCQPKRFGLITRRPCLDLVVDSYSFAFNLARMTHRNPMKFSDPFGGWLLR
jgi:hypothetical protein